MHFKIRKKVRIVRIHAGLNEVDAGTYCPPQSQTKFVRKIGIENVKA